jgi:hypothetical protein
MNSLLIRKKSNSFLRRKQSESGSAANFTTPNDQKLKEEKNTLYRNPRYQIVFETKGSFIEKTPVGITDRSSILIKILLNIDQPVPENLLFRNDLFDTICEKIQRENEFRIIRDISLLIISSAEILAIYSAANLGCLIENVNKGWDNNIPFYGPRPQPNYSVGFGRSAFTVNQLEKFKSFIDDWNSTFFLMATDIMHFPFLTCEVKCGEITFNIADRQNAHSIIFTVKDIVELFRAVEREEKFHLEILIFSISHNYRTVKIYGHYPIIKRNKTTFYRHPIHTFDFTALDNKEKWTAYKFTKNVYNIWMPTYLKRICSAIDQILSNMNFDISQSEFQFSQ